MAVEVVVIEELNKTGIRKDGFMKIIDHLNNHIHFKPTIIETGTARQKGNWSGDGQSTIIWDIYSARHFGEVKVFSLEINQEYIQIAKEQTIHVSYILGDSVINLNRMEDQVSDCKLLYLDSFDFDRNNPVPSALHHMKELTSCWKFLPHGCLIVIDDCLGPDFGKHMFVKSFFDSLGIRPLFEGYQTGWVKP